MNRVTRYALEKTMPYQQETLKVLRESGQGTKNFIDAFKGGAKGAARAGMNDYKPTGKLTR